MAPEAAEALVAAFYLAHVATVAAEDTSNSSILGRGCIASLKIKHIKTSEYIYI